MTEITVIKTNIDDDRVLSIEEREILFQNLSKELKIPYFYLEELGKLEDETNSKIIANTKPNIPSLIIRKLLEFKNVIPVVTNIKHKEIITIDKKGGIDNYRSIPINVVKFQKVVMVGNLVKYLKYASKNSRRASRHQNIIQDTVIDVCGFIIDSNPLKNFYVDTINSMNTVGRLITGNYNEDYLWNTVFQPYYMAVNDKIHNNLSLVKLGVKLGSVSYVLFNSDYNDEKIKIVSSILLSYLSYLRRYNYDDFISEFIYLAKTNTDDKNSLLLNILKDVFYQQENSMINTIINDDYLKDPVNKFLNDLDSKKIFTGKFSFKFGDSVWFDLSSSKALNILEKLIFIYKSKDISQDQKKQYESDIQNIIDKKTIDNISRAHSTKQNINRSFDILKEMKYRWYYIKRFGYDNFYKTIVKFPKYTIMRAIVASTNGRLIDFISKDESKLLDMDYSNEEKLKNITTPWGKLVKSLINSTSVIDRKKMADELKQWLPVEINDKDWVKSAEGLIIICPHVLAQISMENKHMTDTDMRNEILKFAGKSVLFDGYYCSICGELLTYTENMDGITLAEGDHPAILHSLDETLRDYIWKIANQIVRNYVEFKEFRTNKYVNAFVSNIVTYLYDFINMIDKKLGKSKTNSLEEIENKKKIYTIIYIYALLAKIIFDNNDRITFVKMGFVKTDLSKIIKYASDKIISTQNILIDKLPDLTDEFILDSLNKTYNNIVTVIDKARLDPPPIINYATDIMLDPIYIYYQHMLSIASNHKLEVKTPDTVDIYSLLRSHIPSFGKDLTDKLDELNGLSLTKLISEKNKSFKPYSEFMSKYFISYFIDSFNKLLDYINDEVYLKNIYDVSISTENDNDKIFVKINDAITDYKKKTEKLFSAEKKLSYIKKYYTSPAYSNMPYKSDIQFLEKNVKKASINMLSKKYGLPINNKSKLFDTKSVEKFHKHSWNIFVYVPFSKFKGYDVDLYDEKDLIYHTSKDFKDIFNDGNFYDLKLVDTICKFCFYSIKNITKHIPNPTNILLDDQLLTNFYNYYDVRCPNNKADPPVHDFVNDSCKHCNFNKKMYFDKDIEFYKKYKTKFLTDIKKTTNKIENISLQKSLDYNDLLIDVPNNIKNWKPNNNIVNEFASKSYDMLVGNRYKKPEYFNIILNMGLAERYDYDTIIDGTQNPSTNKDNLSILSRINKLDIYIKEIIFDYTILNNYKNMSSLPVEIKSLLDVIDSKDVNNLFSLTNVKDLFNFDTKLSYFDLLNVANQEFKDKSIVALFLLEYLYRLLLEINNEIQKKVGKKNANEILSYFINKLINIEKSSAKLKEVKLMLIEASQKIDVNDSSMVDNDQSRTYDDLVKGNVDQFSYETSDIAPMSLDAGSYNSTF